MLLLLSQEGSLSQELIIKEFSLLLSHACAFSCPSAFRHGMMQQEVLTRCSWSWTSQSPAPWANQILFQANYFVSGGRALVSVLRLGAGANGFEGTIHSMCHKPGGENHRCSASWKRRKHTEGGFPCSLTLSKFFICHLWGGSILRLKTRALKFLDWNASFCLQLPECFSGNLANKAKHPFSNLKTGVTYCYLSPNIV
jgi:hypothetical protein